MAHDDVTLLRGERRVLELVATGAPLRATLEALATLIEAQEPGLRCGILVVSDDGARFGGSYGPSLPAQYHEALAGLPITPPYIGACGEVAHRGVTVIVADVVQAGCYTDHWRTLMLSSGLASLCSTPIRAADGTVLGAFAMHYGQPRGSLPDHPQLIEVATNLAAIALERARYRDVAAARDAQLRASAAQFAALIENAPFGTYVADADFRVSQASQTARRVFGIDGLIGMDLGEALRRIWTEPFAGQAIARFRHTLATGEPYVAADTVEQRADRDAVEAYDWRTERVTMPDGRHGVVCYFYDLSERQRFESELRASEQKLRLFVERAPVAVAMFDRQMRYVTVSRRFTEDYRLVGLHTPDDLVGRLHYEVFPDLPERWRDVHRRVLAGEMLSADADPYVRADGRTEWLRWEMTPWHQADGSVGGAVLFTEVVTARAEQEAALAGSEARFRAAIDAVAGVLWTNNATGEMEGEQPAWAALTGQSYDEYQGYGWARAVHPEDAEPTVVAWHEAVASRRTFVFEHRVRCRDGVWRHFSIRAVPVPNPDGSIKEWVGVHTDVTQQREAQAVLARDKAQLEQLVAARTRELEAAQLRLAHVQRMEALGQLAGGIAHDFNNVLQGVQGGAGLIERRAHDPDSVRRLARMVAESAGRGSAITRRLLAFSRRGDLRAEAVDAAGLLADLREILTHTLGAGIGVRVDAAPGLPPLLADKGQLETVLINLATNARDAMDGKGVLVLAAAADTLPRTAGPRPAAPPDPGDYVRLCVSDTGTGMAPEVLARVTEPFFTTKPQGQGTGLGLAMARGFIEQSGGAMLIESQPGQGTTVHVWLPVAAAAAVPAPGEPAAAPPRRKAARLLVVDDETLVREIIAQQLEQAGYAVVTAAGSREALEVLDAGEPVDLIVSDLSMPEMDGVALVREANLRRPRLPAILLTGFATNAAEIAVGGAVSGLFSLLRKPVTEEELAERVEMLLEGAEASRT